MQVLLDTNGLMVPIQFGVDIFAELERLGYRQFLVPVPVLNELRTLSRLADTKKDRLAAKIGLEMARGCCRILDSEDAADLALLRLAQEENVAVFTNDKELKKRLSSKGITVIRLRQR
ncbi:MAG: DNA-binding protein, partial [Methanothrix sp.]